MGADRKLSVLVHADVAGYSRLIALDDVGTLHRLGAIRRLLIEPEIVKCGGRMAQIAGDSLLFTFESIDSAVSCAIEIQRRIPEADGPRSEGQRLRYRMGIHVGDVISDEGGMHGEGINIAARLQEACPVGSVCLSGVVRDLLNNRTRDRFVALGSLSLKNIDQPVDAFVLDGASFSSGEASTPSGSNKSGRTTRQPVVVFDRSNDFLAAADDLRLPALLQNAREQVWLVGSTFYITVGQYRSLLLEKLAHGVPIHVLIQRPDGGALPTMAALLGVTAEELSLDCMSGIRVLQRTLADASERGVGSLLRVRLLDLPFQSRFYVFDPTSPQGWTFMVPQVGGINSQTVPGFLFSHRSAPWTARYKEAIDMAWNGPHTVDLATWLRDQ